MVLFLKAHIADLDSKFNSFAFSSAPSLPCNILQVTLTKLCETIH